MTLTMYVGRPGGLPSKCTFTSELDGGMGWTSAGSRWAFVNTWARALQHKECPGIFTFFLLGPQNCYSMKQKCFLRIFIYA